MSPFPGSSSPELPAETPRETEISRGNLSLSLSDNRKPTFRKCDKHIVLALVSAEMSKKPKARDTSPAADCPPPPGKKTPKILWGTLGESRRGPWAPHRFQRGPHGSLGEPPGRSQVPPRSDLDEKEGLHRTPVKNVSAAHSGTLGARVRFVAAQKRSGGVPGGPWAPVRLPVGPHWSPQGAKNTSKMTPRWDPQFCNSSVGPPRARRGTPQTSQILFL